MHVYLVFEVSAYTLDISYYETCIYRLLHTYQIILSSINQLTQKDSYLLGTLIFDHTLGQL
jgi:hypothetical protein